MDLMTMAKIALLVAVALLLWWRFDNERRREGAKREHMLDAFVPAVEAPVRGESPWHYANLEGRLDGRPTRIDLVPDTLIPRTLPTLWLQARWARPHAGWLSVTKEWNGAEYFNDDSDAGVRLAGPAGWPVTTVVRGASDDSLELLRRVEQLDLEAYPSLKQLVFTGSEVKATLKCARGDRGVYRVLRSGSFPGDAVTPEIVVETLAVLRAVDRSLQATEEAV